MKVAKRRNEGSNRGRNGRVRRRRKEEEKKKRTPNGNEQRSLCDVGCGRKKKETGNRKFTGLLTGTNRKLKTQTEGDISPVVTD